MSKATQRDGAQNGFQIVTLGLCRGDVFPSDPPVVDYIILLLISLVAFNFVSFFNVTSIEKNPLILPLENCYTV